MRAGNELEAGPTAERELQLLCAIAHAVLDMSEKLRDIAVLAQQQTDLLRRLLERDVIE